MTTHVRLEPGQATEIEQAGGAWLDGRWVGLADTEHDLGRIPPPNPDAPRIDSRTSQ